MQRHVRARYAIALACGLAFAVSAPAQTPPAAPNSAVKQNVAGRKAAFTLVAHNFKTVGDVLQGRAPYDAAAIKTRTDRVAFLSTLLGDYFAPESNVGLPDSKAKADIWGDRAEFDKLLKDFQEHSVTLARVAHAETSASDAFKSAASAVAQDCKTCHDKFREK